ncbi:MAG: hypothetical protein KYX64_01960 [Sphingopyxis sp.]|nr:hypothetical protein [Sphingopyxis sp.]
MGIAPAPVPVAPISAPVAEAWPDEIVVTAPYGAALVKPETELSEDDIAGYGAASIDELLRGIAPLIGGSGGPPILLVNGKRIGDSSGVSGFPPEALDRLAILPPEAAARYGYPARQRVVNLVLKKHFVSWTIDSNLTLPTAGGRDSERVTVGRLVIDGPAYWNVQLQLSRDDALLKSERNLPARTGPVDLQGHVLGAAGVGEIDPQLSLLAGRPVTMTGFPASALLTPPTLGAFVDEADAARFIDPRRYETVLPASRGANFNIGLTRPLGAFSGSINLNASRNSNRQLMGLAGASFLLPAGSPWSPFAGDVLLVRGLGGPRPLRNDQLSTSLGLSATLSGSVGDWSSNFTAAYSRSWANGFIERGLDVSAIQSLLDAGDPLFNPYAPWSRTRLLVERNRSRSESLNAQLNISKAVLTLPAGQLSANLSVGGGLNSSMNERTDGNDGILAFIDVRQSRLNTQLVLNAPIASRGSDFLPMLGELSADLSISTDIASGTRRQAQYSAGLNWAPMAALELNGTFTFSQIVTPVALLNGPRIETVTRVYDYARQEIAEPLWVTGGNPDLGNGSQRVFHLRALLRPFGSQLLTLTTEYQREESRGGVASLPALTPAVEAVFRDRIIRDAQGRLTLVDARPISIAQDLNTRLNSGITLFISGKAMPARAAGPGMRADPGQITLSIGHRWLLKSELLTAPGLPVIDRLAGDGAQSRHNLSFNIAAGKRGMGANLTGNWQNGVQIRNVAVPDGLGDFRYSPMTLVNLGLFVEPEHLRFDADKPKWLSKLRLSLDVQNLFNSYLRVRLSDGSVPPGYSRGEVNLIGRTIRIAVRKQF